MNTADFDFHLPEHLIAQAPLPVRDQSRLMVLNRRDGGVDHARFDAIPGLLTPADLLVVNDSRVFPARLFACKPATGGTAELLLLEHLEANDWLALCRPAKRLRTGLILNLLDRARRPTERRVEILEKLEEGRVRLRFSEPAETFVDELGEVPLPPYIHRAGDATSEEDRSRYQTVYARESGSTAAPTAGLHFTSGLLDRIRAAGVGIARVTLHVGLGTFAPVKAERIQDHTMHEESYVFPAETASAIRRCREAGGRVIAVGTTSLRVLETVAVRGELGQASQGRTRIFIHPPYTFGAVDALITNFHLPRSTLLMLVSAFLRPGQTEGRAALLEAYAEAIRNEYRFFSYGDAMFIH